MVEAEVAWMWLLMSMAGSVACISDELAFKRDLKGNHSMVKKMSITSAQVN